MGPQLQFGIVPRPEGLNHAAFRAMLPNQKSSTLLGFELRRYDEVKEFLTDVEGMLAGDSKSMAKLALTNSDKI